jgi:hypothetical protein
MTLLLTETRERFLRAITAQVSPDHIAEIHFFQPIKQGGIESGVAVVAAWPPNIPPARHVVYTAHYRHTLRGIDRGKWESSVIAEAEAPIVTVDAVVRGVLRRAGETDDPTRLDGDQIREYIERRIRG